MDPIEMLILVGFVYAGIGGLFAVAFATFGVDRVDPAARGTSATFRLLILPGSMIFWPWLARRWAWPDPAETP